MGFVLDVVKLLQVMIKHSSMISWQVMFFKREKSRMENFNLCSYNKCFGEKIVNPLIQLGSLYFYPKEKMSNFPECGLLSQLNMDKLNMDWTYN